MTATLQPAVESTAPAAPPPAGPAPTERTTLVQAALEALTISTQRQGEDGEPVVIERAVYRPDSWLIQKCWETLASAGAAAAALTTARMAAARQPLAPIQALHRLSAGVDVHIGLAHGIGQELQQMTPLILAPSAAPDDLVARDRLLYAATTAAAVGDPQLAFTFLERLDQFGAPWERPIVVPEQRQMLSDSVFRLGLHPLTMALITTALRHFGDAGAQFVLNITTAAGEQMRQQVNQWIRSSGSFDAVIDFDLATRDPDRPTRLRPEFDSGDHIHPNDAGNRAMAEAVDLKLFR